MQLQVNKTKTTTVDELLEVLTKQYSDRYTVKKLPFGKGVMLRKSPFLAVGVYIRPKNKLNIFGTFGSFWVQALFGGLLFIAFVYSTWKKMENETYQFLKANYA